MLNSLFSFAVLFFISFNSFAEGPPWRKVSSLGFNGRFAGIVIHEGDYIQDKRGPYYYEISMDSWGMKSITAEEYEKRFSKGEVTVSSDYEYHPPKEFKTATGKVYIPDNKKCFSPGEGGDECAVHSLLLNDKSIKLEVHHSSVVLNIAEFNNQVWIALGDQGEYRGRGLGLQVYDGKTYKKLFEHNDEYKGGYYAALFHQDPVSKNIWIPTEHGLKIISPDLKTVQSFYFFTDFNTVNLKAEIQLSRTIKTNNFFAELVRRTMPEVYSEVYEATKLLISTVGGQEQMFADGESFVPEEYNVVVPIMLKAISEGKATSKASELLCLFDDPRVIEKVMNMDNGCRKKFERSGLLPKDSGVSYKDSLLNDIKRNFIELSKHESDLLQDKRSRQTWTLIRDILEKAKKLKVVGSDNGFLEINKFLMSGDSALKNEFLSISIIGKLEYDDDVKPGLKYVFKNNNVGLSRVCLYFSPDRGHANREGAEYALLAFRAIQRIKQNYETAPTRPRGSFAQGDINSCAHTFRTQLMLEEVKKQFDELSRSFTKEEKALSEKLQKGYRPELEWKK